MLSAFRNARSAAAASKEFDPAQYWQQRHAAHPDSFKAVGHRLLDDAQNLEQYRIKRERVLSALRQFIPNASEASLLDAGCGIGLFTESFIEAGFKVTAIDFSRSAIESARKRTPAADYIVSPLSQFKSAARFDIVTTIDVLLHIVSDDEWRQTISNLPGHLNVNGIFLILDCLSLPKTGTATHCRNRTLEDYLAAFPDSNLDLLLHERFQLPYEDCTKDLLVYRKNQ